VPDRAVRIVVLASGTGTTLQALLDAARMPGYPAVIAAAGTDIASCPALARAEAAGVPTFTVSMGDYADRDAWNAALAEAIAAFDPDLVVLAGFMRLLGPDVVRRFRIVNTHPSMLPAFPGAHAVRDALADGVASTGVSVHWVDDGVDTGPIITQTRIAIEAGDDEDTLRNRIQAVEKPLYVNAIRQICQEFK
jgi:formyltetrahydrofolate-dependent phosphoribosylglycinamide formyltransferase